MKTENLKKYLEERKVDAELHEFQKHTMTVEAAAKQLRTTPEKIIKSLVFIDSSGTPLLAVVRGDRRVDEQKLAKVSGSASVRIAKAREVERFTRYRIGEVPPVAHGLRTFIDHRVMKFSRVFGGGGSTRTLLEISPQDVTRLADAETVDISH